MTGSALLEVRDLRVRYGSVEAVRGVSLDIHPGEVVAVLGTNGAGKTSLLRAITGAVPVAGGTVSIGGKRLNQLRPDQVLKAGIAHVLEGRHVFPDLTIAENLRVGATIRKDDPAEDLHRLHEAFPDLAARPRLRAGSLSGGQQQMLVTARALLSRPKVLLLDEPSLGLAPLMLEKVADLVAWANTEMGVSVLVVEQHTHLALSMASRVYAMAHGEIVLEATPEELADGQRLKEAYMGMAGSLSV